jgi:magnesium chelatase subunit D
MHALVEDRRATRKPAVSWEDRGPAVLAAALVALEGRAYGGVLLDGADGDTARPWLDYLSVLWPHDAPLCRLSGAVDDDRLIGGLDLAATLARGRPVAERGLLAEADGGIVVLPLADRASAIVTGRLIAVMDTGVAPIPSAGCIPRHESIERHAARVTVIAIQHCRDGDDGVAPALADRLAFHVRLAGPLPLPTGRDHRSLTRARVWLQGIHAGIEVVTALCRIADELGVASMRAIVFAVRAACGCAALRGGTSVTDDDIIAAAQLVLAPRATHGPRAEDDEQPSDTPPHEPPARASGAEGHAAGADRDATDQGPGETTDARPPDGTLADVVVRATRAVLDGVWTHVAVDGRRQQRSAAGRSGARRADPVRGRAAGCRRGVPGGGARLDLLATLRAAAPWQRIHRTARPGAAGDDGEHGRPGITIRRDDLRIRRHAGQTKTTVIFVVDASGSAAAQRMAEAKGAVELLLGESYARRDQVSLIAFRGLGVQHLLAPTRALARARRMIAALPAGGATPLATALEATYVAALKARRDGSDVTIVLLTDARANVARDGRGGRAQASADALASGRRFRGLPATVLLIDTASRPVPLAAQLAGVMGARYVPLPNADAHRLSAVVRASMASDRSTPTGVGGLV